MAKIDIPDELAEQIDLLVGADHRTAYIIEVLGGEVRRTRQRSALCASAGVWKPENHPELVHGGAVLFEAIRTEPDERFEQAMHRQQGSSRRESV